MARVLTRFDDVIKALGGVTEAGRLIDRQAANICQWRAKYGRFPAGLYFRINEVLAQHGCEASARVFRFEEKRAKRG
jgi:hypothetical protein